VENNLPIENSPSMSRRQLLNFLTGSVIAVTATGALYPAVKFLLNN
jgi:cytochrome b6-f complex iron-sulfur subunit